MAGRLAISHELTHDAVIVRALSGQLDETFDQAVLALNNCRHLILDLSEINQLSSFGVRDWIKALRAIRTSLDGLFFVRASPRMTDQFNMVVGFDGGGVLLSFLAYYRCTACGEQSTQLFDRHLDRPAFESLTPPVRQCAICGCNAELDDDPSILFEYARSTAHSPPPPPILGAVRDPECWLHEVPGVRLTTRQAVEGDTTILRLAGIIDGTFPTRQVADIESPKVALDMLRVTHFDATGFERWRTALQTLAQKGATTLVGCPPVVLRRFVEDPLLVGGATVSGIVLPANCPKCRQMYWRPFSPPDSLNAWLESQPTCTVCNTPLNVADRDSDFRAFLAALHKADSAPKPVAPPPITRVAPKPATVDPVKQRFGDKYEYVCRLAQGGMADVHLVRQHGAMGFLRLAVIKQVREDLLTDDRMMRLFLEEARLVARIDHPNIIRVYDFERVEGTFCMVLEFVHGRSIAEMMTQVISRKEFVPPQLAAGIVADLCRALARAHQPDTRGHVLVHRDVTPNNVLVTFDGNVKLVDFGLAAYNTAQWGKGTLIGSPAWLAPEIYLHAEATPQTDIWGAGLLLLAMISGANPFSRATIDETAIAIVEEPLSRPVLGTQVPLSLFAIASKCLAKKPTERYLNATAVEKELRAAMARFNATIDLSAWIRSVFAHEIRFENEFVKKCGASDFVDALLKVDPENASRFFRFSRGDKKNEEATRKMDDKATPR